MVTIYYIITYDIGIERIDNVRIFLKQYLNWVQNSVFEGELTSAQYTEVKKTLLTLTEETDHIIIYKTRSKKYLDRETLGTPKAEISRII